ncbi:MAG: acetylxylan esterase [Tannerella sp.]|jgi:cephalosporin-C deacetylase-like acetyl esterase|nr:acetylxylan esterase [Tannerella sp.]
MQKRKVSIGFLTALLFLGAMTVTAQLSEKFIKVNIAPQHGDWVYKPGEQVKFDVVVTKNDVPVKDVEISYEYGPEMMTPVKQGKETLKDGKTIISAGTLNNAGFLRCRVFAEYDGKRYDGLATAAFSPEAIQPTTTLPADFVPFWNQAKDELAKLPVDARVTLLPERCTAKVNVYHVNIQNYKGSRLYGILCVPKAPGKYPALLKVPGAGVRGYYGDVESAERGAITFEMGIHGIPVNLENEAYVSLGRGALDGYFAYNLDNKDRYYYKRVYLGCVRSIDYIFSLPEFDGSNLVVSGGSQGGALAIVTAGLDSRITGLVSFYPALCDLTGYLHGRAGGWPHLFNDANKAVHNTPQKVETSTYYDVVNFARQVNVPGFYSWGYNDVTCPPTSLYSAYNVITAPKTLFVVEETGHWTYPEQWAKAFDWAFRQLKK